MEKISHFIRRLVCCPIILYQCVLSPFIRPCCRYYPSCSQYALLAIKRFGVLKGLGLTLYRLLRCHPWAKGGYDPVLPNKEKR
ncbi:membrane protein insertion efficiency factor YidD [Legionella fairfieldensis]|uniref:membrane protein insertion efficiency factor YidD n=1 Tax=Legionella fairfieldensis TaxID=45064 RepID=UPI0009FEDAF7|nr:membrane protein insertion efficiency factor YidD [Legionella fairfieldensis]